MGLREVSELREQGKVSRSIPYWHCGWIEHGVGEFVHDLSECPRPKVLHLVRIMLDDG
jgi:hypothetical protein